MVSVFDSTRMWSMQTSLRIFKEEDKRTKQETGGESAASSILAQYGIDTGSSDGDGDASTYSLADMLSGSTSTDEQAGDTDSTSGELDSKSFMTGLKARLEDLKRTPSTRAQAEAMLAALEAGKLNVTDAEQGKQITAWDPEAKDAEPMEATGVDKGEWSSFLRDHLSREPGGKYALNQDGSYTDRTTGHSAYFGMIGERYYYLTWSAAA